MAGVLSGKTKTKTARDKCNTPLHPHQITPRMPGGKARQRSLSSSPALSLQALSAPRKKRAQCGSLPTRTALILTLPSDVLRMILEGFVLSVMRRLPGSRRRPRPHEMLACVCVRFRNITWQYLIDFQVPPDLLIDTLGEVMGPNANGLAGFLAPPALGPNGLNQNQMLLLDRVVRYIQRHASAIKAVQIVTPVLKCHRSARLTDDFFSWIRHNSHTPGVSAPLRGSTVWQAAVPETDDEKYLSCGNECCPNLHSMRLAHFVSEWERVQPTTKGAKMSHVEKLHRMKTMRSKQASYVRASHLCFCGAENSPLPLQRLESLKVCIPHPLSCCWRSPDAADRMNEFTQVFTYDNCMYRTHRV